MKYCHIVFDIDGTLIDTNGPYLKAVQHRLEEELGIRRTLEELAPVLGVPGRTALAQLGFQDIEGAHEAIGRDFYRFAGGIRVFDGVEGLLAELQKRGIVLGLVTSKSRVKLEEDFMPLSISPYFSLSVCAQDTRRHKPDPEPMLCYLSRAGLLPGQVLYVGDNGNDLAMCRAAGVDCALALWGAYPAEREPGVRYLSRPAELLELL